MTTSIVNSLLVNTIVFSVLFCLIVLLRKLLSGKISAVMQYMLLAVVVLKLIIPFGFESTISPLGWMEQNSSASTEVVQREEPLPEPYVYSNNWQAHGVNLHNPSDEAPLAEDPTIVKQTQMGTAQITQAAIKTAPLHWSVWVCIVWLVGVAAMALRLFLGLRIIRRHTRHTKTAVPRHIAKVFDACKKELGVKRHIELVMQTAIPVPAVTGIIKPILIVPDSLANMDTSELQNIFLHELTHFKHRDIIKLWIMNCLNCLYWFNPLVWLCFKLMRNDIETICDQRCLRLMDRKTQKNYVDTVLHFAGLPSNKRLQAAIAMTSGRTNMEKRIRNMFKIRRTKCAIRILVMLVATMMMATCVLTACQPTPEAPLVIHKTDDIPKDVILQTDTAPPEVKNFIEPVAYSISEHWTETVKENDFLTIEVDADILMPEVEVYPVERLERSVLTQERVDELIAYFTESGTKFYSGGYVKLKSEYAEDLIYLKQNLQNVLNGADGETPESIRSHIKEVEHKMAEAPESHTYTYVEPVFTYRIDHETGEPRIDSGENTIYVNLELPDGSKYGSISARRYEKGKNTGVGFTYRGYSGGWTSESFLQWYDEILKQEVEDGKYDNMDDAYRSNWKKQRDFVDAGFKSMQENPMDPRAAADRAIELLEELGIEGLQLKSYEKVMFSREHGQEEEHTIPGCYVEFVRECGGIPSLLQCCGSIPNEEDFSEFYCAPFNTESVTLIISEDGVEHFSWSSMAQEVERVAEDTTLMPLDEVKQRIIDYAYYINGVWLDRATTDTKRITIKEIRLVTTYINAKDDPERVLIVPAWHITAQEEYLFDHKDDWTNGNLEEFMINALDGSNIFRPGTFMERREE